MDASIDSRSLPSWLSVFRQALEAAGLGVEAIHAPPVLDEGGQAGDARLPGGPLEAATTAGIDRLQVLRSPG